MHIQLISGPRNISTALMYSFAQRADMAVVDEPFYAYYLKETGVEHPGRKEVLQRLPQNVDDVFSNCIHISRPEPHLFIKNMAHHLLGVDLEKFEKNTVHLFLIRNPKDLIASFSKVIKNPILRDIGLGDEAELYRKLRASDQNVVVANSDELLKNPPEYLLKLCDAIGLPFDESMLSWSPGPRPEDGVWAKYWYKSVHKSTGFSKPKSSQKSVPSHLVPLLHEAQIHFNFLNQYAIKL